MPYSVEISRVNPTAFIFLLDQSSSMWAAFAGQPDKRMADGVADAINSLLLNIVLKCTRSDGVRDFFHIGMLRYDSRVNSAFDGPLAGSTLVPLSQIANNPLRIEVRTRKVDDGADGVLEQQVRFPVWFDPRPTGQTFMCEAFRKATEYVKTFLAIQPNCYPPIVMNITDGQPTDGTPKEVEALARELRALQSRDGNVLLFNAHLSEMQNRPVEFPSTEDGLVDDFAKMLFRMSSELPPQLLEAVSVSVRK